MKLNVLGDGQKGRGQRNTKLLQHYPVGVVKGSQAC